MQGMSDPFSVVLLPLPSYLLFQDKRMHFKSNLVLHYIIKFCAWTSNITEQQPENAVSPLPPFAASWHFRDYPAKAPLPQNSQIDTDLQGAIRYPETCPTSPLAGLSLTSWALFRSSETEEMQSPLQCSTAHSHAHSGDAVWEELALKSPSSVLFPHIHTDDA